MENETDDINSRITPEKALQLLKKEGMVVTLEQAKEILYFLRRLANIAVLKFLKDN